MVGPRLLDVLASGGLAILSKPAEELVKTEHPKERIEPEAPRESTQSPGEPGLKGLDAHERRRLERTRAGRRAEPQRARRGVLRIVASGGLELLSGPPPDRRDRPVKR